MAGKIIDSQEFIDKQIIPELKKLNSTLLELAETQSKIKKSVSQSAKSHSELKNSANSLAQAEKRLSAADKELISIAKRSQKVTKETVKAQLDLTEKRKKYREELQKEAGATKKSTSFTQKLSGAFKLAAIQVTAALAALKGIIEGAKKYIALVKEVNKQTSQTAATFQLTKEEAKGLTTEIRTIATAFDKEFNDVLKSANILSKEFGLTGSEALDLINKGFEKGADVNGEFLELLKEYPAQLSAVGFNAEQAIAVITQTEQAGVFSDKGLDAIKEAGIRLRELTPATKDALNAIGLSSKEIEIALADGSKTLFDVIKEVSGQLDTLPPQSAEVGTAIADIFGGAGEDAGLRFLKTLKNIDTDLNNVESTLSETEQAQIRLRKEWETLRTSTVGGGGVLSQITNAIADLLENINKLRVSGGALAASFTTLFSLIKTNFQLLGTFFKTVLEPFKLVIRAINAIQNEGLKGLRTAFKQTKDSAIGNFTDMYGNLKQSGQNIVNSYKGQQQEMVDANAEANLQIEENTKNSYNKQNAAIAEALNQRKNDLKNQAVELASIQAEKLANDNVLQAEQDAVVLENRKLFNEKYLELEKEKQEGIQILDDETAEKIQDNANTIAEIGNTLFEIQSNLNQKALNDLETQKQHELSLVAGNAAKEEQINKKYAAKEAQLKKEQAQDEKNAAIFSAIINTAIGITGALATQPTILGIILAALVAASGAVQIAAIQSEPLPQFAKGVKDFEGGKAIVGEKGTEIISTPDGMSYLTPDKPTLVNLPKGSDVIPHGEINGYSLKNNIDLKPLIESNKRLEKAIINKPVPEQTMTGRGFVYANRKANSIHKYKQDFFE